MKSAAISNFDETLGRNLNITLVDYTNEIISARERYAMALYNEANDLMNLDYQLYNVQH